MNTGVPPEVEPTLGLTEVTSGMAWYVYWSVDDTGEVPPGVVTVTLTVPGASAGEIAVMEVPESTVNLVAAVESNLTSEAPTKFVPVIVTRVPPAVGPAVGLTEVTEGVFR